MSEQENLDLGKVIGLIMENPQLIEQISSLARQKSDTPKATEQTTGNVSNENIATEEVSTVSAPPTYQARGSSRGNRAQLLGALKPYVSQERAKAIDSMISIADILEMMRAR